MNKKGFTLIELLLVVLIIGFMLAVIVPRGLRANTDAKYNLVRQNGSELAAYGNDWIEQQILAQNENSTATRADYLDTLVLAFFPTLTEDWIARTAPIGSNWNKAGAPLPVVGRNMGSVGNFPPDNSVEAIIEPAKMPRNPFNGASVFLSPNDPSAAPGPIPGAIACARASDSSTGGAFDYYSFVFQGTDSTLPGFAWVADYHGGMTAGDGAAAGGSLAGVREGVFFTKVRQ